MMPTKTKPAKKDGAADPLEQKLQEAILLVSAGKAKDALPLFEAIDRDAAQAGNYALARAARNYLTHEKGKAAAPPAPEPLQEAVYLLNAKKTDEALEAIDGILKKDGSNARAHYIKALAHAKAQRVDLSAECLKSAIALDPSMLHIYRLEPEFRLCRRSSLFASFELA
jgi:tetratricopeptide (TPR) repeat protein